MKESFENHRLRSCLWIANVLERHKALTLHEINQRWVEDENISGGVEISRRTFYNYIMAETYGIVEPMSQEDLDAFVKEMEENHPELYDKKFPQDVYLGIR